MKIAIDETGQNIRADTDAPDTAFCPYCGGQVTLRRRRSSYPPGSFSYFWRHQDRENQKCPGRVHSIIHIRLTQTSDSQ